MWERTVFHHVAILVTIKAASSIRKKKKAALGAGWGKPWFVKIGGAMKGGGIFCCPTVA